MDITFKRENDEYFRQYFEKCVYGAPVEDS